MGEEKKKKQLQKTEKNAKKFEQKTKGINLNEGLWKGKKNEKVRASDWKVEIKNIPELIYPTKKKYK